MVCVHVQYTVFASALEHTALLCVTRVIGAWIYRLNPPHEVANFLSCCEMTGAVRAGSEGMVGVGGSGQREEARPSCLALSNDLCIMKDGDNISRSLQGSTLWQHLHIHIFSLHLPSPIFTANDFFFFFFPWEQDICLPDTTLEEEK